MNEELAKVIKKYRSHPQFLGIDVLDPNQLGALDDTMLHIAASMGAVHDVEVLVAAGANVNAAGDLGHTPLHQAAMSGHVTSVRRLLELGADPKRRNEFDQTAADTAKLGEHDEVVRILRSHGG
jgi:ankyrin repeat protein